MKNIKVLLLAVLSMLVLSSNAQLLARGVSQELAQHRKANISNVIYDLTFNIPANLQEKVTGKVIITFDLKYSEDIILDFQGELKLGDTLTVADIFTEGVKFIDVVGTSKGKGFQGVVKRHGFAGVGGVTHGQHNRLRHPGSMGASSWPSRVFPGMRMAGHMGNERVKVFNLKVVKVIPENNLLVVKGSVPGAKGSYVILEA